MPETMAQWQELLNLDQLNRAVQHRVGGLYQDRFSLQIRRCLSCCIESQDWDVAAADENRARTCFQALLLDLEKLRNESFHNNNILTGPDYSLMKDYLLNHFESQPQTMAAILSECLKQEKTILNSRPEDQHCSSTTTEEEHKELDSKLADLKKQTEMTEHKIKSLEVHNEKLNLLQKTRENQALKKMNGVSSSHEAVKLECLNQANFIKLTEQGVIDEIGKSVNLAEHIVVDALIAVELPKWKLRQQMACIGSPVSTCLEHLQMWFTDVAESLLKILQQLKKLKKLSSKHNIAVVSSLSEKSSELLKMLLKHALVVEKQPVMSSQTHRPLVLKTVVKFTVAVRFLVKVPVLQWERSVKAEFDKDVQEVQTIKGFRRFEFTTNNCKVLDMYTSEGDLVAEFGDMKIKENKTENQRPNENPIRITEELHVIKFSTELRLADVKCQVETSSLPLVVVSSSSQIPSAWASVMWRNMLCSGEPWNLSLFVEPPPLPWEQLSQALSWQFLSAGGRELDEDQLSELKDKFVDDPDELVSWSKFSKKEGPWLWVDGILDLIEKHLKGLWEDGSITGFVSKEKTRLLLQNKQSGNFLLRFSESNREGAITFSWVEHCQGKATVHAIDPFTKTELSNKSLADHINQYRLKKKSTNPLVYLYPDIPKDCAFGRYYTPCEGNTKPKAPYVRRRYVCEGDCPSPPPSPPSPPKDFQDIQMDIDTDFPLDPLTHEELQQIPNVNINNVDFTTDFSHLF